MQENGVRGLRFSVWNPENAVVSFDDCLPLSERIKDFDWNIQLHMKAAQLVKWKDIISRIRTKIVIDHMGRLDPRLGLDDPAYKVICKLIDAGNTWVKLSGPYLNTVGGCNWEDASKVAVSLAKFAPERVIWGSDWPHVTETVKPVETVFTDLIPQWLPTKRAQELALVKNPEELYGFGK